MKRTLSMILTFLLCLGLCACGHRAQKPIETTTMELLLEDAENGARAQMNIGKAVKVYGRVRKVYSEYCVVDLLLPHNGYNALVHVEMPAEQLAQLENRQFVALHGMVMAYSSSTYKISADEMLPLEEMDAYLKEKVASTCARRSGFDFIGDTNAGMLRALFYEEYNVDMLEAYVTSRGSAFMLTEDAQLREYLIGGWVYSHGLSGMDKLTLTYYPDDTSLWQYRNASGSLSEQTDDWHVAHGLLDSIWSSEEAVYVLHEDVFLIEEFGAHIRILE